MNITKESVILYWKELKEIGFVEYFTVTPFEYNGVTYKNLLFETTNGTFYLRIDCGKIDFWFKSNKGGTITANQQINEE